MNLLWLNPAAWLGLLAIAVPVAIHLLLRREAPPTPFPTIRFLVPSRPVAIRRQIPSDWILLAVRAGIVSAAVAALAGPLLETRAREAMWASRIARAIVIDTSASMKRPAGPESPESRARTSAEEETRSAFRTARIESADLRAAMRQATAWLGDQPPSSREIVCISDFQTGALSQADLDLVPPAIGLRFVAVGAPERSITGRGPRVFFDLAAFVPSATMTRDRTEARFEAAADSATGGDAGIVVIAAERERPAAEAAVRAALAAGAHAGAAGKPVAIVWPDGRREVRERTLEPWMAGVIARLVEDRTLLDAVAAAPDGVMRPEGESGRGWVPILRDRHGRPRVGAAAIDTHGASRLGLLVLAEPSGVLSPALVQAALNATVEDAWSELEPAVVDRGELQRWEREPAGPQLPQQLPDRDGRWLWLLALALLAAEAWLRRGRLTDADVMETERVA
jgi:hypothetical protein